MTKIAFIAHATAGGGAERSIVTTLTELLKTNKLFASDCLLVLPRRGLKHIEGNVYEKLEKQILSVWWNVPFGLVFRGAVPKLSSKLYRVMKEGIAAVSFLVRYNHFLRRGGITTVHLNSTALWALLLILPKEMRCIMHVRETLNDSWEAKLARWTINKYADMIIAIDANVAKPFNQTKTVIIPNPIDMTAARGMRKDKEIIKEKVEGIRGEKMVISMIGNIGAMKGTDFLFDVANRMEVPFYLVAGNVEKDYKDDFFEKITKSPNIKFLGFRDDLSTIYAITDINIRCEDYFPLGRTTWEGIYAGGVALLPAGEKDDLSPIKEYLGKYIYTYETRNVGSCVEAIRTILKEHPNTIADSGFPVSSNIKENAEQMVKVLTEEK